MEQIFFAEIPLVLKIIITGLQSLSLFWFIFYFCEIKFSFKLLFSISLAKILFENWFLSSYVFDFFSVIFINLAVNIIIVYIFTRVFNYKVVIAATLTAIILLITVPTVTMFLISYYPSTHPHIVWFIARIPQIIILNFIVIWAQKTSFMRK